MQIVILEIYGIFLKQKIEILNTYIDNLSLEEALQKVDSGIVVTPNIHHLVQLQNDSQLQDAYSKASFRLCDSQIIYFILKILGEPIKAKLSGSDLFPRFIEKYSSSNCDSIFLFGSSNAVLESAQKLVNEKFKRKVIAGCFSPSYKDVFDKKEIKDFAFKINSSSATVLILALTGGKQEKLAVQLLPLLDSVRLILCFGAGVDFYIGAEKRAPKLISKIGLEWLWRIYQLQNRILFRYLNDLVFFRYFILWILKRNKNTL